MESNPYYNELLQTSKDICQSGKGILAADESTGHIYPQTSIYYQII